MLNVRPICAFVLLLATTAASHAEGLANRPFKTEPAMGALKPGQRVLVDDGSCGPGQIKEVIGGNHHKVGGTPGSTTIRQRRCIPR